MALQEIRIKGIIAKVHFPKWWADFKIGPFGVFKMGKIITLSNIGFFAIQRLLHPVLFQKVAGMVCAFLVEKVAIYELVKAGRTQEALAIYQWFLHILELDISSQMSPRAYKKAQLI